METPLELLERLQKLAREQKKEAKNPRKRKKMEQVIDAPQITEEKPELFVDASERRANERQLERLANPEYNARLNELKETSGWLTAEQYTSLIWLKEILHKGSCLEMRADLRIKLQSRPYIFKLVDRIEVDLSRIERIQSFEEKYSVNAYDIITRTD